MQDIFECMNEKILWQENLIKTLECCIDNTKKISRRNFLIISHRKAKKLKSMIDTLDGFLICVKKFDIRDISVFRDLKDENCGRMKMDYIRGQYKYDVGTDREENVIAALEIYKTLLNM